MTSHDSFLIDRLKQKWFSPRFVYIDLLESFCLDCHIYIQIYMYSFNLLNWHCCCMFIKNKLLIQKQYVGETKQAIQHRQCHCCRENCSIEKSLYREKLLWRSIFSCIRNIKMADNVCQNFLDWFRSYYS